MALRIRIQLALALAFVPMSACEPSPPDEPPAPPPVLDTPYEVNPTTCDAGQVPLGGVGQCVITVTNVSDIEVNVTGATDGPPFIAVGANGALAPGDSLDVTVNAAPRALGVDEGELALGPGRLIVPLVVEGIEDAPPVEVEFSVTPSDVVAGDVVTIDSGVSPGAGVTFAWTLVFRPQGSTAALTPTDESVTSFGADLAGVYGLELLFTDDAGEPGIASVNVDARAPRNLTLTTSGEAVLHFRPSAEALCGPLDCFADNCEVVLGNGPRQSPTAAGGGIVVEDVAEGTYRVALVLAGGATQTEATLRAFESGSLRSESFVSLTPGEAHDVLEIVASPAGLELVAVDEAVADDACP